MDIDNDVSLMMVDWLIVSANMNPKAPKELKEFGELLKESLKESMERRLVHLCNDCEYGCMAACPITKNVKFGNGQGNDNVIECENYINKEALNKWRINKIISRGDDQ